MAALHQLKQLRGLCGSCDSLASLGIWLAEGVVIVKAETIGLGGAQNRRYTLFLNIYDIFTEACALLLGV